MLNVSIYRGPNKTWLVRVIGPDEVTATLKLDRDGVKQLAIGLIKVLGEETD